MFVWRDRLMAGMKEKLLFLSFGPEGNRHFRVLCWGIV